MARDPIELELVYSHKDICALFGYGDVNITVWYATGDEPAVLSLEPPAAKRIASFPRGVSGVQLISHEAGMPTAGARNALAAQGRKWAKETAAVAVVIEHTGFFGSAMRSVVTGIQLLAKAEFPIRVFASLQEAADWLPIPHAERTGTVINPASFCAALKSARESRGARQPSSNDRRPG